MTVIYAGLHAKQIPATSIYTVDTIRYIEEKSHPIGQLHPYHLNMMVLEI